MARPSIIDKLSVQLRLPIENEMQVVYILVELRKLLEHDNKKEAYPVINFYGNWVVHTKLSTSPIADKIIRLFDDCLFQTAQGAGANGPWAEITAITSDVPLQAEMKAYLESLNLPTTLCTSPDEWFRFRRQLANVIEDAPLELRPSKKQGPTQFIKTVVVKNKSSNADEAIKLEWHHIFHTKPLVYVKDGRFIPQSQWPNNPPKRSTVVPPLPLRSAPQTPSRPRG